MSQLTSVYLYLLINLKIIKELFIMSSILTVPLFMLKPLLHWSIANQEYIAIVSGTIVISHLFGSWYHWQIKKDFTIAKNLAGLCLKIAVVTGVGLLFEGFSRMTIENDMFYTYLKMTLRLLTLTYPLRSALVNCFYITKGAFPPKSLITKIQKFETTLNLNDLIAKEENNDIRERV
jgi:hypothetical protein